MPLNPSLLCEICMKRPIPQGSIVGLCPECQAEVTEVMAALVELSDGGKKGVPLEELSATLEERARQKSRRYKGH